MVRRNVNNFTPYCPTSTPIKRKILAGLFVSCQKESKVLTNRKSTWNLHNRRNCNMWLGTGVNRFSKNLWVASKFYAIEGWYEESFILRPHKCWMLPYKMLLPWLPAAQDFVHPCLNIYLSEQKVAEMDETVVAVLRRGQYVSMH